MTAATKPWLKLWTEIRTDLEMRTLPPAWRWAFVGVLCLAQDLDAGGALVLKGKPMSDAAIADAIGVDLEMWREVRAHFCQPGPDGEPGSFVEGPNGALFVVNFAKRQAPADSTAAARQARYRQSKSQQPLPLEEDEPTGERDSNALHHASHHAQPNAEVTHNETRTEDRGTEEQSTEYRALYTESVSHMRRASPRASNPALPGETSLPEPVASGTVDPALFLSRIGFEDADGFLRNHDRTLIAKWAFHYNCLTPQQRAAIRSWPAAINAAIRANKPPRLNGAQSAAFYRIWMESQTQ